MAVERKYTFGALGARVRVSDGAGAQVFNTGIAFEFGASKDGIKLTHLHVGPTLVADAEAVGIGTRLLVFGAKVPEDLTPYQQNFEPTTFDPFPADSTQGMNPEPLYAGMYVHSLNAALTRTASEPDHADFDDGRCPEIHSAGELSIVLVPMLTAAMVAALVPDMFVYLQMNAWGVIGGQPVIESARNIPPSRIGRV